MTLLCCLVPSHWGGRFSRRYCNVSLDAWNTSIELNTRVYQVSTHCAGQRSTEKQKSFPVRSHAQQRTAQHAHSRSRSHIAFAVNSGTVIPSPLASVESNAGTHTRTGLRVGLGHGAAGIKAVRWEMMGAGIAGQFIAACGNVAWVNR